MAVKNVCVVGLGTMGMGAAKSCIRGGLNTYGGDISDKALQVLKDAGAVKVSKTPKEFGAELDAVIVLVVNAAQVRSVLFGDDPKDCLASSLKKGTPVMVSSTMAAADAKDIAAKLAEYGLPMLDAPVSGGGIKANAGEMTVMASGAPETFEALKPVFDAIATKVYNIGTEFGLGSSVKIVHQLLAGVHIAVAAEAMAMAKKAGIPLDIMYDVVTHAAGNSWMFENRMAHVLAGDYTPLSAVDIFVKDLGLVTDTAKALHFPIPLASTAYQMFTNASNAGFGRYDDSAVIMNFSGLDLPVNKH